MAGPKKRHNPPPVTQQNHLSLLQYSGPLPPSKELAQYDLISPGAATAIIGMAVAQSEHRRNLEQKVIDTEIRNSTLGMIFGFIIGITAIVAGTACILKNHEIGGSIIGGAGLTSLVSVFVYGARVRSKERESRIASNKPK